MPLGNSVLDTDMHKTAFQTVSDKDKHIRSSWSWLLAQCKHLDYEHTIGKVEFSTAKVNKLARSIVWRCAFFARTQSELQRQLRRAFPAAETNSEITFCASILYSCVCFNFSYDPTSAQDSFPCNQWASPSLISVATCVPQLCTGYDEPLPNLTTHLSVTPFLLFLTK